MMYLVDTTVFIYSLRGQNSATNYLINLNNFYISSVSVGELYQGCKNKQHLRAIEKIVKNLSIIRITEEIDQKAIFLLKKYRLEMGLGFFDALIAATAMSCDLILISDNLKHFKKIKSLSVQSPDYVDIK